MLPDRCPNCASKIDKGAQGCGVCGFDLSDFVVLHVSIPYFTVDRIPGYRIVEAVATVTGSTVRTRHLGSKLVAGISSNFGGELSGYTKLLQEAREQAIDRMLIHASDLGADAVIGLRLITSEFFDVAVEMVAMGTAVRTAPDDTRDW